MFSKVGFRHHGHCLRLSAEQMELEEPNAPWPKEICFDRVEQLRLAFISEKRAVRNWNEGQEGDANAALVSCGASEVKENTHCCAGVRAQRSTNELGS